MALQNIALGVKNSPEQVVSRPLGRPANNQIFEHLNLSVDRPVDHAKQRLSLLQSVDQGGIEHSKTRVL